MKRAPLTSSRDSQIVATGLQAENESLKVRNYGQAAEIRSLSARLNKAEGSVEIYSASIGLLV